MARGRPRVAKSDDLEERGGNPIDIHVGSRIRLRRTLMGLSQEKLGHEMDLTFQQVQKYERGANRVSASRLYNLSTIMDVPVSFFFDDMDPEVSQGNSATSFRAEESPEQAGEGQVPPNAMFKRETLELVRSYYRIKDPATRKALYNLVKATATSFSPQEMADEES